MNISDVQEILDDIDDHLNAHTEYRIKLHKRTIQYENYIIVFILSVITFLGFIFAFQLYTLNLLTLFILGLIITIIYFLINNKNITNKQFYDSFGYSSIYITIKRHIMKEEIYRDIHQLQVKVQLLEEREKGKK